MRFEYVNSVRCTKEEAWALITDLDRRPEWIHFMEKCYWTDKKPGVLGSRYQEKEVFLGIPLNISYEVVVWKEMEQMSSKCMMPPLYPVVDILLREEKGACICTLVIEMHTKLFRLIPERFLHKQVDALVQPFVDEFIRILESETKLS